MKLKRHTSLQPRQVHVSSLSWLLERTRRLTEERDTACKERDEANATLNKIGAWYNEYLERSTVAEAALAAIVEIPAADYADGDYDALIARIVRTTLEKIEQIEKVHAAKRFK